jgi:hypothetical protein
MLIFPGMWRQQDQRGHGGEGRERRQHDRTRPRLDQPQIRRSVSSAGNWCVATVSLLGAVDQNADRVGLACVVSDQTTCSTSMHWWHCCPPSARKRWPRRWRMWQFHFMERCWRRGSLLRRVVADIDEVDLTSFVPEQLAGLFWRNRCQCPRQNPERGNVGSCAE